MQDRKKVLASISLVVFAGWIFLHWVGFGLEIDDAEFDAALVWAEETGIKDTGLIREYPFSPVTRAEAAERYVLLAQDRGLVPTADASECVFADLGHLSQTTQERLILSCRYDFFKGTDGNFYPDAYVTKANSLVGLMRGLYPGTSFPLEQPYRTPYVSLAYEQGITKRPSGPYLMYLITKYELILQLSRAYQLQAR